MSAPGEPPVVAVVPARGGSRGIPGKNLLPLRGRSLTARAVACARRAGIERVLVSTDDPRIAAEGRAAGGEVPALRPAAISGDDARSVDAVLHALDTAGVEPGAVLLLQPTSPLRRADDLRSAVALLGARPDADAVVSVAPLEEPHPAKAKRVEGGWLVPFVAGSSSEVPRQALPAALRLDGSLYLVRTRVVRAERTLLPKATLPLPLPAERALNLDHPWDVVLLEALLERGLVELEED